MSDNQPKPREFDAVLGGKALPPTDGVVLGGIEGVKHRLKSINARERATALIDALRYGKEGLDLLTEALIDPSEQVRLLAGNLLKNKGGEKGRQTLLKHNPSLLFTTLDDWEFETYSPDVGINASVCTAYNVNCYNYNGQLNERGSDFTLEYLQAFLRETQVYEVEALACWTSYDYVQKEYCNELIELLCQSKSRLTNLKALFIGDIRIHEYKESTLFMSEINPILEAFPDLQVLKLHGKFEGNPCFKPLQHSCLKTLIVETQSLLSILADICRLNLPALEYLEVWNDSNVHRAAAILTGQLFPNLYYLGLPSFEDTDGIMKAIAQSPTHRLAVLDLHLGELTDKGAEILINNPIINHLHTLNIAKNCLSEKMIQRLSELNCQVIAQPQYGSGYRYFALYE